ncbi:hypothetical protein J4403_04395 [Candidatus Woesearchaeota archaeon]|nr:hypothetical protein [Candidatus Woesearchaeota archaeon]
MVLNQANKGRIEDYLMPAKKLDLLSEEPIPDSLVGRRVHEWIKRSAEDLNVPGQNNIESFNFIFKTFQSEITGKILSLYPDIIYAFGDTMSEVDYGRVGKEVPNEILFAFKNAGKIVEALKNYYYRNENPKIDVITPKRFWQIYGRFLDTDYINDTDINNTEELS